MLVSLLHFYLLFIFYRRSGKQSVDLSSLGTLVKYGSEVLFGFIPRKVQYIVRAAGKSTADVPSKLLVDPKLSLEMRELITETYTQLSSDLVAAHKNYKKLEKKLEKDKLLHGSITEQKQNDFDQAKRLFEKLHSTVVGLAECSEFEVPTLEVQ